MMARSRRSRAYTTQKVRKQAAEEIYNIMVTPKIKTKIWQK